MNKSDLLAEQIRRISGVDPHKCMKCGKCSATCPSFSSMDIKPHQFVSYVLNNDIVHLLEFLIQLYYKTTKFSILPLKFNRNSYIMFLERERYGS